METKREHNKRIKTLLKKHKKLIGSILEPAKFEEPIALLKRQSGNVEFYEKIKGDKFVFTHSNKKQRFISLDKKYLCRFDYGKHQFLGYILDENYPIPITEKDPLIPVEEMGIVLDKTLHDRNKWEADVVKQKGNMYWKILIGLAILAIAAALAYQMVPPRPEQITTIIREVNQTIVPTILG